MAKFMKSLAVIVLIASVIGSFVLGDTLGVIGHQSSYSARNHYNIVAAISGVVISFIAFGLLYSIGYALSFLDDLRVFWKVPAASTIKTEGETLDVAEKKPVSKPDSMVDAAEQKVKDSSNPWA